MIKVRVLVDGFMIGFSRHEKGSIVEINPGAVNYCVGNGSCELVKPETKASPIKKPVPKKKPSTYKTKQTLADDIL